jgi:hypothetical protein
MIHRHIAFTVALCLGGILIVGVTQAGPEDRAQAAEGKAATKKTTQSPAKRPAESTAATAKQSGYSGLPVLDPSRYFGEAAMGYASAKAAPEVMSVLFCYCGCDATDGHHHLIDCFTSNHGVDCHICQEEAVEALKLYRAGTPIATIQQNIDEHYSHHYPFGEDTQNYKTYKASRLWTDAVTAGKSTGGDGTSAGPFPAAEDGKNKPSTGEKAPKSATGPKVKPGFKVGNCCGEHK